MISSRALRVLAVAAACSAAPLPAQEAETTGYHVVRLGETLEEITAQYLGTWQRWRDNWQLNPELENPHAIFPGQKLKILVRRLPEKTARLTKQSRRVKDKLGRRAWEGALDNDLLLSLDQLQTFEGASAEILFADDTVLVLTEETLVILGEEEPAAPVDRQLIEIEFGQADLEGQGAAAAAGIEIKLGDAALAKPQPAVGGTAVRTRNRVREGVGQVMVYDGKADLEAAGQRVEVAEGMGSSVVAGQAPAPPERLLDPPAIGQPQAGSRYDSDPTFGWQMVPGARAYTVEVCLDPRCGELVARATQVAATTWNAPEPLPLADLYWRATAVSASGLDGYPSSAVPFSRISARAPAAPIRISAATLFFNGPKVGVADRLIVGPGTTIEAQIDPSSDFERWLPWLDGAETTPGGWQAPFATGSHTAAILAVDRGKRTVVASKDFIYDPDPPTITWGVEDAEELGAASGEGEDLVDPTWHKKTGYWARVTGSEESPLVWTSSKIRWLTMRYGEWEITSDRPYILVRARKKPMRFPTLGLTVTKDQGFWIHAVDPVCGIESMTYQILVADEKQDEEILVIDALDALGNRSRITWPFSRARRAGGAPRHDRRAGGAPRHDR